MERKKILRFINPTSMETKCWWWSSKKKFINFRGVFFSHPRRFWAGNRKAWKALKKVFLSIFFSFRDSPQFTFMFLIFKCSEYLHFALMTHIPKTSVMPLQKCQQFFFVVDDKLMNMRKVNRTTDPLVRQKANMDVAHIPKLDQLAKETNNLVARAINFDSIRSTDRNVTLIHWTVFLCRRYAHAPSQSDKRLN